MAQFSQTGATRFDLDGPRLSAKDLPIPEAFVSFHPFLKGVFSQWHPTPFIMTGQRFATAEQWMMFAKARLFEDEERAEAIVSTDDPSEQKRLGQQVADFDQAVWDEWKIQIVYLGNMEKFRQNQGAGRQLHATRGAMLVEANPRDWIWGAGLSMDDASIFDPRLWRGSNLLGRILTKVRNDLEPPPT